MSEETSLPPTPKPKANPAAPDVEMSEPAAEGTGTVHRTIRLIAAIAATKTEIGVGDLSAKLALPVPTIHRLLQLLRKDGMVEWNSTTRRYAIGPELFRISSQVLASTNISDIALREIERLCELTGETVLFGLYQPGSASMSFSVRAEGSHPLQYRIQMHTPLSLIWGASGKAILAFLGAEDVTRALQAETAEAKNGSPPPPREQLDVELARVRKNGFAVSEGEKLLGARGIAAPVFGLNGVLGSICITSPRERIPIDRIPELGEQVRDVAQKLSRGLGGPLNDKR